MLVISVALWFSAQTPKTIRDLESAKVEAIRGIKSFRLEMNSITVFSLDTKSVSSHVTMLRDGDRFRINRQVAGVTEEDVNDGQTMWSIFSAPKKIYREYPDDASHMAGPMKHPTRAKPQSWYLDFDWFQARFDSDTPLKIKSIEDVHEGTSTLRKVIASDEAKGKPATMTLIQWFLPDKWILKRFYLNGHNENGPFMCQGEVTVLDFNAKITPRDFALDPSMIKGFRKVQ
jgi:hypothetical protein